MYINTIFFDQVIVITHKVQYEDIKIFIFIKLLINNKIL